MNCLLLVDFLLYIKDTLRENAPSNKTPTFTKIRNTGIWVVGISN